MWLNRFIWLLSVAVMLYLVQLAADRERSEILLLSPLVHTGQFATVEDSATMQTRHETSRGTSGYVNAFTVVNGLKMSGSESLLRQKVEVTGAFSRSMEITPASDRDTQSVSVTGSLFDGNGFPIRGEPVYLSSDSMHFHQSTLTDSRGFFTFPGVLPAYSYRLAVTPTKRYRKHSVDPFIVSESPEPVNLILEAIPVGSVSGSVVDAFGLPVEHISLVVYSSTAGTVSSKVETNVNGWFLADNVPAGHVTLAISAPAYVPIHTMSLDPDELAYAQVALDSQWKSLRGKVRDSDGTPLGGIKVHLVLVDYLEKNAVDWQVRTNTDGTFSFCIPMPPPYKLLIHAPGFRHFATTIETADDYFSVFLDSNV